MPAAGHAAMMALGSALYSLLAALAWGGGDFAGGMGVKRAGGSAAAAARVVLLAHALSLAVLIGLILLRHEPAPARATLLWGLAAGLFGGTSCLVFYLCLATGAMGAAAALSGLLAAAIPALVSFALEGAPRPLQLVGFAVAAAAIWFIASSPGASPTPPRTLRLALLSGFGFGLYFVSLRMAGQGGILLPLALSRCGSVAACAIGALLLRPPSGSAGLLRSRPALLWVLASAVLDTGGNVFYLAATRSGRLDVAAVLTSLYPASTILLAAWLLRERPTRRQGFGMALAAAAVVLITA